MSGVGSLRFHVDMIVSTGQSFQVGSENYQKRIDNLIQKRKSKLGSEETFSLGDSSRGTGSIGNIEVLTPKSDADNQPFRKCCGFCNIDFTSKAEYHEHVNFSKLHTLAVLEFQKKNDTNKPLENGLRVELLRKLSVSHSNRQTNIPSDSNSLKYASAPSMEA